MSPSSGNLERLMDLLADRTGGEHLGVVEEREIDRLLYDHPEVDPGSFDRAAAAIHLALLTPPAEEMPARLRDRLLEQADSYFMGGSTDPERRPAPRPVNRPNPFKNAWLGWLAAAAAVVLLVTRTSGPLAPTPEQVARADDVIVVSWQETEDPDAAGVTGDVTWSGSLQTGYMRFSGLPANDPGEGQYQLWIFDGDRPAEHPVDGGVFDSVDGEIVVPIDAKLAVAEPTLFAITYERPGGVVVSTRERLLLLASVQ